MSPDVEQLLRESLHTAPPVTPRTSDPLAEVARRVRRARAIWGGGTLAAAAVVAAAVVVPLSVVGGSPSGAGTLVPGGSPSPAASNAGSGLAVWDRDAVDVASGGGWLWELQRNPKANDGSDYVVKVDPRTHEAVAKWDAEAPADYIAYGLGRVWVWGGGDGGYRDGRLQIVDAAPAETVSCPAAMPSCEAGTTVAKPTPVVSRTGVGFADVAFLAGSAWATTGDSVWQIAPSGDVVSKTRVGPDAGRVVVAGGHLWVGFRASNAIGEYTPQPDGHGLTLGVTQSVMDASLRLLDAAGETGLLVSEGSLVQTERLPSYSGAGGPGDGAAVPEVPVSGRMLADGGAVVLTVAGEGSAAVYRIPAAATTSSCPAGACVQRAPVGADVTRIAVNPVGGVEIVLDDGTVELWQPAS
jgi:hypothetical protein